MLQRYALAAVPAIGLSTLGVAHAQTTDDLGDQSRPGAHAIIPEDDTIGPVGVVDELMLAHSDLTDIMLQQTLGNFDTPDFPFIMTYVDEEKGDLVVMMDAFAAFVGMDYEEEAIRIAIGHDVPVEIIYGSIFLDAAPSRAQQWVDLYRERCVPIKPGDKAVCDAYARTARSHGADLSGLTGPAPRLSSQNPCDVRGQDIACYYYNQYRSKCIPSYRDHKCSSYSSHITTAGFALPTRAAPTPQPAGEPNPTNVRARLSGTAVTLTWTAPDHDVNYYKVTTYRDDRYVDRDYVSGERATFRSLDRGHTYVFKVIAYYDERVNGRISSSTVSSNSVTIPGDTSPPRIRSISNINVQAADSTGATVRFSPTAYDSVDGTVPVTCTPASGSKFPVGSTKVTCTARDSSRNTATGSFTVTVEPPSDEVQPSDEVPPVITAPSYKLQTNNSAGIIVDYIATAKDARDGVVGVTCSPLTGSLFPVGVTTVTCTATDSSDNTATKTFTVEVSILAECLIWGSPHTRKTCDDYNEFESDIRTALGVILNWNPADDLLGGSMIVVYNSNGLLESAGTVGLVISGNDGTPKVIAASHVVNPKPGSHTIKVHHISNLLGTTIGPIEKDSVIRIGVRGGNIADAALLDLPSDTSLDIHVNKIRYKNEVLSVTSFGGASELGHAPIHIAGIRHQGSGGLQYKNITLSLELNDRDVLLINQMSGSYPGLSADSGAPVFTKDGTNAAILGINIAHGCVITLSSGQTLDARYSRDGVLICDPDTNPPFHFFTPWENIVAALDLGR
ncbi:MAG: HYR domain-containing protein [Nitrosopumilus sp.]|nr:HYR domain-containing protein [Nitrosopumilus sp.]MDA7958714.1 HYR domain-containing protein [Nitrosopumilus sp.]